MSRAVHIIGIAGATCSGKSALARRLKDTLAARRPALLSLDSYYRDLSHLNPAERDERNFDEPDAIDHELLIQDLERLAQGRGIYSPVYDFATHSRLPQWAQLVPGELVIVEGLFALYWEEVRRILATKVFVELSDEVALSRRLDRDIAERGRTRTSVLEQYRQTVRPMAEKYILPTRDYSDVVVSGEDPLERSATVIIRRVLKAMGDKEPNA